MFTSQNAVAFLWEALRVAGRDARALAGRKLACVGPADRGRAARARARGRRGAGRYVAEGVLEALDERDDVRGRARAVRRGRGRARRAARWARRAWVPRGRRAACTASASDGAGAGALREALARGRVDAVTFASASAVRGFVEAVGAELARRAPAVSIGPVDERGGARRRGSRSPPRRARRRSTRSPTATVKLIGGAQPARRAPRERRRSASARARRSSRCGRRASSRRRSRERGVESELVTYRTLGDKRLDEPLSTIGAKGLFTEGARGRSAEGEDRSRRALAEGSADRFAPGTASSPRCSSARIRATRSC